MYQIHLRSNVRLSRFLWKTEELRPSTATRQASLFFVHFSYFLITLPSNFLSFYLSCILLFLLSTFPPLFFSHFLLLICFLLFYCYAAGKSHFFHLLFPLSRIPIFHFSCFLPLLFPTSPTFYFSFPLLFPLSTFPFLVSHTYYFFRWVSYFLLICMMLMSNRQPCA